MEFKTDGTFVGKPLPYDLVLANFSDFRKYLQDIDDDGMSAVRKEEIFEMLSLFEPAGSLADEIEKASFGTEPGADPRSRAYKAFDELVFRHAIEDRDFLTELEEVLTPQACAVLIFGQYARRAQRALSELRSGVIDSDMCASVVANMIDRIRGDHRLQADNDDEIATEAVKATVMILKGVANANEELFGWFFSNPGEPFLKSAAGLLQAQSAPSLTPFRNDLNSIGALLVQRGAAMELTELWERTIAHNSPKRKVTEQGGSSSKKGKAAR